MAAPNIAIAWERFRQNIAGEMPVYAGPNRVKIGYYRKGELDQVCKGVIYVYKDAPRNLLSPKDWIIEDGSGNLIFLDQYCIMNNISSPWRGANANPAYTVTTPSRRREDAARAADPVGSFIQDAASEVPWWVWAGAGGLILLSILRR